MELFICKWPASMNNQQHPMLQLHIIAAPSPVHQDKEMSEILCRQKMASGDAEICDLQCSHNVMRQRLRQQCEL